MRQTLLLEGQTDDRDQIIETLEADAAALKRENVRLEGELLAMRSANTRAVGNLQRVLTPLHRALQQVFGEMEEIGTEAVPAGGSAATGGEISPRVAAVWGEWKKTLGPSAARVIQALLIHGELNTTQLTIAAKMRRATVNQVICKMNKPGLLNKIGGRFSLKEI